MKYLICSYGNGIAVGLRANNDEESVIESNCIYNFSGVKTHDYLFDGVALFSGLAAFYRYLVKKELHAMFADGLGTNKETLKRAFGRARLVWRGGVTFISFMSSFCQSRRSYTMGRREAENFSDHDS